MQMQESVIKNMQNQLAGLLEQSEQEPGRMRKAHEIVCFSYFINSGIMYANHDGTR